MPELQLVGQTAAAGALLHPMRMRILDALREPSSASGVARQLGLARQKVNYHLRELEKAGFIEEVEQRRAGNCIERIVRAKSTHYLIHPELLGNLGADPEAVEDRFSSTYLIALAAQAIRDVASAQDQAAKSKKRIATLTLQGDVRFANAADREAFANELANAFARLVARYHREDAEGGRTFRFIVAGYPARKKEKTR
jgi:DNA-binding transcriptional ArsR family regulator